MRQWPVRTLASVAVGGVLLLWRGFLIAWLALRREILPHIDEWRSTLARTMAAA